MVRSALKRAAFAIAAACVWPMHVLLFVARHPSRRERTFQGFSHLLSLVPFRAGTYLRAAYYARACTAVDREVAVGFLTLLSHTDTDIGRHSYIGAQCNIGSCAIGRDCLFGSGVHVLSGKRQHDFSDPDALIREQGGRYEKIRIGENCWIGNHATIMADVGAHSIIAAGAVVVDEVPPRSIVGGNPARILKSR